MSKKVWFKNKWYGYGVYPVSWEGVVMTLVLIGLVFGSMYTNNVFDPELLVGVDAWKFQVRIVIDLVVLIGLFLLFAERHMDEPLEWRWGRKK